MKGGAVGVAVVRIIALGGTLALSTAAVAGLDDPYNRFVAAQATRKPPMTLREAINAIPGKSCKSGKQGSKRQAEAAGLPPLPRAAPPPMTGPATMRDFINTAGIGGRRDAFDGPVLEVTVPVGILDFLLDTHPGGNTSDNCRTD